MDVKRTKNETKKMPSNCANKARKKSHRIRSLVCIVLALSLVFGVNQTLSFADHPVFELPDFAFADKTDNSNDTNNRLITINFSEHNNTYMSSVLAKNNIIEIPLPKKTSYQESDANGIKTTYSFNTWVDRDNKEYIAGQSISIGSNINSLYLTAKYISDRNSAGAFSTALGSAPGNSLGGVQNLDFSGQQYYFNPNPEDELDPLTLEIVKHKGQVGPSFGDTNTSPQLSYKYLLEKISQVGNLVIRFMSPFQFYNETGEHSDSGQLINSSSNNYPILCVDESIYTDVLFDFNMNEDARNQYEISNFTITPYVNGSYTYGSPVINYNGGQAIIDNCQMYGTQKVSTLKYFNESTAGQDWKELIPVEYKNIPQDKDSSGYSFNFSVPFSFDWNEVRQSMLEYGASELPIAKITNIGNEVDFKLDNFMYGPYGLEKKVVDEDTYLFLKYKPTYFNGERYDSSTITVGAKYVFVSQDYGKDSNDGLTDATPVYSLNKAVEIVESLNDAAYQIAYIDNHPYTFSATGAGSTETTVSFNNIEFLHWNGYNCYGYTGYPFYFSNLPSYQAIEMFDFNGSKKVTFLSANIIRDHYNGSDKAAFVIRNKAQLDLGTAEGYDCTQIQIGKNSYGSTSDNAHDFYVYGGGILNINDKIVINHNIQSGGQVGGVLVVSGQDSIANINSDLSLECNRVQKNIFTIKDNGTINMTSADAAYNFVVNSVSDTHIFYVEDGNLNVKGKFNGNNNVQYQDIFYIYAGKTNLDSCTFDNLMVLFFMNHISQEVVIVNSCSINNFISGSGGAPFFYNNGGRMDISSCTIEGLTGSSAGIFFQGGGNPNNRGFNVKDTTIKNCTASLIENYSVSLVNGMSSSEVIFDGCNFLSNTISSPGFSHYADSLILNGCTFDSNYFNNNFFYVHNMGLNSKFVFSGTPEKPTKIINNYICSSFIGTSTCSPNSSQINEALFEMSNTIVQNNNGAANITASFPNIKFNNLQYLDNGIPDETHKSCSSGLDLSTPNYGYNTKHPINIDIDNCNFKGNKDNERGGCIFIVNPYISNNPDNNNKINISNCKFEDNKSSSGGQNGFTFNISGYSDPTDQNCDINLSNINFNENHGVYGCGLYINSSINQASVENCKVKLSDVSFYKNSTSNLTSYCGIVNNGAIIELGKNISFVDAQNCPNRIYQNAAYPIYLAEAPAKDAVYPIDYSNYSKDPSYFNIGNAAVEPCGSVTNAAQYIDNFAFYNTERYGVTCGRGDKNIVFTMKAVWLDGVNGSDDNDGLDYTTPKATIQGAMYAIINQEKEEDADVIQTIFIKDTVTVKEDTNFNGAFTYEGENYTVNVRRWSSLDKDTIIIDKGANLNVSNATFQGCDGSAIYTYCKKDLDGGAIRVKSGTLSGGAATTFIAQSSYAIYLEQGLVELDGSTFKNSYVANSLQPHNTYYYEAPVVVNGGTLNLTNALFDGISSKPYSAIHIYDGSALVSSSTITNCNYSVSGGSNPNNNDAGLIYAEGSTASVEVIDCKIYGNLKINMGQYANEKLGIVYKNQGNNKSNIPNLIVCDTNADVIDVENVKLELQRSICPYYNPTEANTLVRLRQSGVYDPVPIYLPDDASKTLGPNKTIDLSFTTAYLGNKVVQGTEICKAEYYTNVFSLTSDVKAFCLRLSLNENNYLEALYKNIYVNGISGDNMNSGISPDTAVRTFEEARTKLELYGSPSSGEPDDYGSSIVVTGTVTVDCGQSDVSLKFLNYNETTKSYYFVEGKNWTPRLLASTEGFEGDSMINICGTSANNVTLENFIFDGLNAVGIEAISANNFTSGVNINIKNSIFQNFRINVLDLQGGNTAPSKKSLNRFTFNMTNSQINNCYFNWSEDNVLIKNEGVFEININDCNFSNNDTRYLIHSTEGTANAAGSLPSWINITNSNFTNCYGPIYYDSGYDSYTDIDNNPGITINKCNFTQENPETAFANDTRYIWIKNICNLDIQKTKFTSPVTENSYNACISNGVRTNSVAGKGFAVNTASEGHINSLNISGCEFNNFVSEEGATIYLSTTNVTNNLKVANTKFNNCYHNNTTHDGGAAIFVDGFNNVSNKDSLRSSRSSLTIANCMFVADEISAGSGIIANGADIYIADEVNATYNYEYTDISYCGGSSASAAVGVMLNNGTYSQISYSSIGSCGYINVCDKAKIHDCPKAIFYSLWKNFGDALDLDYWGVDFKGEIYNCTPFDELGVCFIDSENDSFKTNTRIKLDGAKIHNCLVANDDDHYPFLYVYGGYGFEICNNTEIYNNKVCAFASAQSDWAMVSAGGSAEIDSVNIHDNQFITGTRDGLGQNSQQNLTTGACIDIRNSSNTNDPFILKNATFTNNEIYLTGGSSDVKNAGLVYVGCTSNTPQRLIYVDDCVATNNKCANDIATARYYGGFFFGNVCLKDGNGEDIDCSHFNNITIDGAGRGFLSENIHDGDKGGAFSFCRGGYINFNDISINDCISEAGGGIDFWSEDWDNTRTYYLKADNVSISNCTAYCTYGGYGGQGGAIRMENATFGSEAKPAEFHDLHISNCKALGYGDQSRGGGIDGPYDVGHDWEPSTVNITGDSVIENCETHGHGGGICAYHDTVNLKDNTLVKNCSATTSLNGIPGKGGGLSQQNGTLNLYDNAQVSGCHADGNGGGLFQAIWYTTTFTMNGSSKIFNCDANGDGGGVYLDDMSSSNSFTMNDASSISGCGAKNGGALFSRGWSCSQINISGMCQITENVATQNGGAFYFDTPSSLTSSYYIVKISGAWITNNKAADGGAMYSKRVVQLDGTTITGNTTTNTNVATTGDAYFSDAYPIVLSNSETLGDVFYLNNVMYPMVQGRDFKTSDSNVNIRVKSSGYNAFQLGSVVVKSDGYSDPSNYEAVYVSKTQGRLLVADAANRTIVLGGNYYIDGQHGSDTDNDGTSPAKAFQTLDKATALLSSAPGVINICDLVEINSDKTYGSSSLSIHIKRYDEHLDSVEPYTGQLIRLSDGANVSFTKTTFDCAGTAESAAIFIEPSSTLTLNNSSILNADNTVAAGTAGATFAGAIYNKGTLNIYGESSIKDCKDVNNCSIIHDGDAFTISDKPFIQNQIYLGNGKIIKVDNSTNAFEPQDIIEIKFVDAITSRQVIEYTDTTSTANYKDFKLDQSIATAFVLFNDATATYKLILTDIERFYIDGVHGNDANTGLNADNSIQTLERAYELVRDQADGFAILIIVDTITTPNKNVLVSNTQYNGDLDNAYVPIDVKDVSFLRYSQPEGQSGFSKASNKNALFNVGGSLTMSNVVIDGHSKNVKSLITSLVAPGITDAKSVINVGASKQLTLTGESGVRNQTQIINNSCAYADGVAGAVSLTGNDAYALFEHVSIQNTSGKQGGAVYVANGATLDINTFKVGDYFTTFNYCSAQDGGAIYNLGTTNIIASTTIQNCTSADGFSSSLIYQGGTLNLSNTQNLNGDIYLADNKIINVDNPSGTSAFSNTGMLTIYIKDAELDRTVVQSQSSLAGALANYPLSSDIRSTYTYVLANDNKILKLDYNKPVYVDGQMGNDSQSGLSPKYPLNSLTAAYNKINETNANTIYIVNTIDIRGSVVLSQTSVKDGSTTVEVSNPVNIVRYSKPTTVTDEYNIESFKGSLFDVKSGVLRFKDIVIDGHSKPVETGSTYTISNGVEANAALIKVSGGTLGLTENSVLTNANNASAEGLGGAVYVDSGSVMLNGTTISNVSSAHGSAIYSKTTVDWAGVSNIGENQIFLMDKASKKGDRGAYILSSVLNPNGLDASGQPNKIKIDLDSSGYEQNKRLIAKYASQDFVTAEKDNYEFARNLTSDVKYIAIEEDKEILLLRPFDMEVSTLKDSMPSYTDDWYVTASSLDDPSFTPVTQAVDSTGKAKFGAYFYDGKYTLKLSNGSSTINYYDNTCVVNDDTCYHNLETYTVHFFTNDHGIQPEDQVVIKGGKATDPNIEQPKGYIFNGWFKDYSFTIGWDFNMSTVNSPTTLYAKWQAKTTTVTLDNNGSTMPSSTITATFGQPMPQISLTNIPKLDSKAFTGYFASTETSKQYYNFDGTSADLWDIEDANYTLYAHWADSVCRIIYPDNTYIEFASLVDAFSYAPYTTTALDNTFIRMVNNTNEYNIQVDMGKNITLDLNGKTVNGQSNGNVFVVYGNFVVDDQSTEKNGQIIGGRDETGGCVKLDDKTDAEGNHNAATFRLENGKISSGNGKCVSVWSENASFTMNGGEILNTSTSTNKIVASLFTNGSATINGGTINNGDGNAIVVNDKLRDANKYVDINGGLIIGQVLPAHVDKTTYSNSYVYGEIIPGSNNKIATVKGAWTSQEIAENSTIEEKYLVPAFGWEGKQYAAICPYSEAPYTSISVDVTNSYTIKFSAGLHCQTAPSIEYSMPVSNSQFRFISGDTFTQLDGYVFAGWDQAIGATTPGYSPGDIFTNTAGTDVEFFVISNALSMRISFNANGGIGGPDDLEVVFNTKAANITELPTKVGYKFDGYYSGTTTSDKKYYDNTGKFVASSVDVYANPFELYAHWTAKTYTVNLDANGGTGGRTNITATYDQKLPQISRENLPKKDASSFNGYFDDATDPDSTRFYYSNGISDYVWQIDVEEGTQYTIYAQWTDSGQVAINTRISGTYYASIDDAFSSPAFLSGDTIKLVSSTEENFVLSGIAGTLDLNGYTITGNGTTSAVIAIDNGSAIRVMDSSEGKNGQIYIDTNNSGKDLSAIHVQDSSSDLIYNDISIVNENKFSDTSQKYCGILFEGNSLQINNGSIFVTPGTVNADVDCYSLYVGHASSVDINGGIFDADNALYCSNLSTPATGNRSVFNIYGGIFKGNFDGAGATDFASKKFMNVWGGWFSEKVEAADGNDTYLKAQEGYAPTDEVLPQTPDTAEVAVFTVDEINPIFRPDLTYITDEEFTYNSKRHEDKVSSIINKDVYSPLRYKLSDEHFELRAGCTFNDAWKLDETTIIPVGDYIEFGYSSDPTNVSVVAYCTWNPVTVTFDDGIGQGGPGIITEQYWHNATLFTKEKAPKIDLTEHPEYEGYEFIGYYDENNDLVYNSNMARSVSFFVYLGDSVTFKAYYAKSDLSIDYTYGLSIPEALGPNNTNLQGDIYVVHDESETLEQQSQKAKGTFYTFTQYIEPTQTTVDVTNKIFGVMETKDWLGVAAKFKTDDGVYSIIEGSFNISIKVNPKVLDISWDNLEFTYDGTSHLPSCSASGMIDGEDVAVAVVVENDLNSAVNQGTYSAYANNFVGLNANTDPNNYAFANDRDRRVTLFTIYPKEIEVNVGSVQTKEYDGKKTAKVNLNAVTGIASDVVQFTNVVAEFQSKDAAENIPVKVISYDAVVPGGSIYNYSLSLSEAAKTAEGTITKKTIELVWGQTNFVYDGELKCPVCSADPNSIIGPEDNKEIVNVAVVGGQTDAGTYTATANALYDSELCDFVKNYKLPSEVTQEFVIEKAEFERSTTITLEQEKYTYTGEEIRPTDFTVYDVNDQPMDPNLFEVSYYNNINVSGDPSKPDTCAQIILQTKEECKNYSGTKVKTFVIEACDLSDVSLGDINLGSYDATHKGEGASVIVTYKGKTLEPGATKDYTYTWSNDVNAGENIATLTITANEKDRANFKGTITRTYSIKQYNNGNTDIAAFNYSVPSSFVYDTTSKAASASLKEVYNATLPAQEACGDSKIYYYSKQDDGTWANKTDVAPTDAGTYKVCLEIAGGQNFAATTGDGIELGTFNIAQRPIFINGGIEVEEKVYDGSAEANLKTSSLILKNMPEGQTLDIQGIKGSFSSVNAGQDIPVSIDYSGVTLLNKNYLLNMGECQTTAHGIIFPKYLSDTNISCVPESFDFDEKEHTPIVKVMDGAKELVAGKDYSFDVESGTYIGTYKGKLKGIGNYDVKAYNFEWTVDGILEVTEGTNPTYTIWSGDKLDFSTNGNLADFVSLYADDKFIEPENYVLSEPGTNLQLLPSCTDRLSPGTHKLIFNYKNGDSCETNIEIVKKEVPVYPPEYIDDGPEEIVYGSGDVVESITTAPTGDVINIVIVISIILLAMVAFVALIIRRKNRTHNK